MKKIVAIMLALVLALSLSAVVFADDVVEPTEPTPTPAPTVDMNTITITKDYQATDNTGVRSPAETFKFTIVRDSVSDAAAGVTAENMPIPTIGTVEYVAGEAGSATMSKNIIVDLPTYNSVGIYTYTVTEDAGTTAGVTYYDKNIKLVVTVQQGENGTFRVASVHTEAAGEDKTDNFPNKYSAGSLLVSKKVTGNMGDQTKEFKVTVEFTAPTYVNEDGVEVFKDVNEAITYTDGEHDFTITPDKWVDGKASAVITLKHGETVGFVNIPYDVTYTVLEEDYTTEAKGGYDAPVYNYSDAGKKIDSAADAVGIVNNKGVEVDTGISVDSIPYILLLAVVAIGVVAYVGKKRVYED